MNDAGDILGEAQRVIDANADEKIIIEKLEPTFERLNNLDALVFASFVKNALRIKRRAEALEGKDDV